MTATLLLPCAGKSSRYPGVRPKWMLTLPGGELALQRAAASLASGSYKRIVAAVRAEHETKYGATALLKRVFGPAIEVLVLEHDTRGPADTVAQAIRRAGISGAVAIKDADSFFDPAGLPETSFVALSDVRASPQMNNVGAKSFAVINENNLIVEMVEKSLSSNFVSVGLYGFADASLFLDAFDAVSRDPAIAEVFVSHVLNRAIADGMAVEPHFVSGLIDVGTLEDWRRHVRARGTIVTDLDGVVFENHSRYFAPFWEDEDVPIASNVSALRFWQDQGAQLVFMTARPDAYRQKTERALAGLGLKPHALIMDCRHGRRFLVNDHAASNPYPSAVAISMERNSPSLADYMKDWM
ncbi:MAG: NTP transferase domain-containing protein [Proteobacteria bacterium]|nr:NTP transferase domain-containing protein [Pseudomonadota bacterium]